MPKPRARAITAVVPAQAGTQRRSSADTEFPLSRGRHAETARSTLFVNSVEKAMRVLTAFDGSRRQLTLSQIAALIEMDISATQRFTYTLANLGYLRKDEANKTYELSPKAFDFAYHYLASSDLVQRATP